MMAPYKAQQIAEWFIAWAEYNDVKITRLKLLKLIYFAQGYSLAILEYPLFDEVIQAWEHGPVVKEVWTSIREKDISDKDFEVDYIDDFDFEVFSDEENQLLADVWATFGDKHAKHLEKITHLESPWIDAWEDGKSSDVTIYQDVLEEYYSNLLYTDFINSEEGEDFVELFEKAAA